MQSKICQRERDKSFLNEKVEKAWTNNKATNELEKLLNPYDISVTEAYLHRNKPKISISDPDGHAIGATLKYDGSFKVSVSGTNYFLNAQKGYDLEDLTKALQIRTELCKKLAILLKKLKPEDFAD